MNEDIEIEMETPGSAVVSQLEMRIWIRVHNGSWAPGPAPKWTLGPYDNSVPLRELESRFSGLDENKLTEIIKQMNEITEKEFRQDYGCATCEHIGMLLMMVITVTAGGIFIGISCNTDWWWALVGGPFIVISLVFWFVTFNRTTRRYKEATQCAVDALQSYIRNEINPGWLDTGLQWSVDILASDIESAKKYKVNTIGSITVSVV